MKALLIRHGQTAGNLEKRYIGRTDEPLCEAGIERVQALYASGGLPAVDAVFVSPYRRCLQTAAILFPGHTPVVVDGLRECDFGDFEGRTAQELEADIDYCSWLDTQCTAPVPGGESVDGFKARCAHAFGQATAGLQGGCCAFVIHGGSIMAILERFALPARPFYEYHIENAHPILCEFENGSLRILD